VATLPAVAYGSARWGLIGTAWLAAAAPDLRGTETLLDSYGDAVAAVRRHS
jgi:hypothetical protein